MIYFGALDLNKTGGEAGGTQLHCPSEMLTSEFPGISRNAWENHYFTPKHWRKLKCLTIASVVKDEEFLQTGSQSREAPCLQGTEGWHWSYSLNRDILSTYCVPGTALDAGEAAEGMTKHLAFMELIFLRGRVNNKQK